MTSASSRISEYLGSEIARGTFPGARYLVGRDEDIVFEDALGHSVIEPEWIRTELDTIYDLASLTKPLITSLLAVILAERGAFDLDSAVSDHVEEFRHNGSTGALTIKQLMTHTSGIVNWLPLYIEIDNPEETPARIARAYFDSKGINSGSVLYSDLNYILVGALLERLTDRKIEQLAEKEIFAPLGLSRTLFRPSGELKRQIAATEGGQQFERANAEEVERNAEDQSRFQLRAARWLRTETIWGEVHDGNAYFLGGATGHAGLFSTAREVFQIARQFLAGSKLVGDSALRLFRENLTPGRDTSRSIGWILAETADCSAGPALPPTAMGHNGFTGTSVWMDPDQGTIMVLLTNRVHPKVGSPDGIKTARKTFHTLAVQALNQK
jgi:serine-type D-Ala-D-Ala carboxypeptidase